MNSHPQTEVLVREGIRQASAPIIAPATYPVVVKPEGHTADLLARIDVIRTDLGAGNVEAAIRGAHFVGGHSARHGHRRVASLVRHAVRGVRSGLLDGANELLSQAQGELKTV